MVPRPHQRRPVRELAGEQRGLGAVAGALLGHPAADLALRRGTHARRRLPAELGELAGRDVSRRRPAPARRSTRSHSPARSAARAATRVPEVIDAWYDSGAMPFAQWGYHPDLGRGEEEFERHFPADFISEAIDQTRGWFYTLMAEGVLQFDDDRLPERRVPRPHRRQRTAGRCRSRWATLRPVRGPGPTGRRRAALVHAHERLAVGIAPDRARGTGRVLRQFLLTLWNVYAFFVTYANAEGFDPDGARGGAARRSAAADGPVGPVAARRGHGSCRASGLDAYDATARGPRASQAFVDDLSNWYVRRSRRRFWDPGGDGGADDASRRSTRSRSAWSRSPAARPVHALHLRGAVAEPGRAAATATRLGPPVRLPRRPRGSVDPGLDEAMAAARHLVELGRHVRVETKTRRANRSRRPSCTPPSGRVSSDRSSPSSRDELNVKRMRFAESADELRSLARQARLPGRSARRSGSRVKALAAALAVPTTARSPRRSPGRERSQCRCRASEVDDRARTTSTWCRRSGKAGASPARAASRWRWI